MAIFWAILASLANAAMLYYLLFKDFDDFVESVKYCFTPNIISAFKGKWLEDAWAEIKILIFLGVSLLVGILTYINIK